ncbi:pollen-specific leucine-rich repeat extensin-like protein 3 [Iris pallida]|uniref:Pollen-specific leucine-rich repeat extensin-like protein 3 n=1 Tax=Iris pallida TaxID=29817 RepID=A0AAX6DI80_IRIPA|nr:pollen-specific leucine-rich repeat extensin-like protein 3 [Iris pallida]
MLRMLSCVTTAIMTLCCTQLYCQSPRRRTMGLRPTTQLLDRFPFCIVHLFQNSVFTFRTIFICI